MKLLEDLEALAKEATQGEWHQETEIDCPWNVVDENGIQIAIMQQRTAIRDNPNQTDRTANAAFIAAASPATILAIAARFRELKISFEAEKSHRNAGWREAHEQERRAEAAEAEIARIKAAVPVAYLNAADLSRGCVSGEVDDEFYGPGMIPVHRLINGDEDHD